MTHLTNLRNDAGILKHDEEEATTEGEAMTAATPAPDVSPSVLDFLRRHTTVTLATASPGGIPRATILRYVNEGLTLHVWTRSQSWTARQIEQNPLVSFAISDEGTGLQGSGEARAILSGTEVSRVAELYSERFPITLGASTMDICFFRIAPTDVKLIDETYGGGRGDTHFFGRTDYRIQHVYNVVRDLPTLDLGSISGSLQTAEHHAGSVVAREGAPADKFVIVLDGEVEVARQSDDGPERVATLGPSDFFGDVAVLRDTPRTATLTALTDTRVLTMDREQFCSVVAQSLGTDGDFDHIVRERLRRGEGR